MVALPILPALQLLCPSLSVWGADPGTSASSANPFAPADSSGAAARGRQHRPDRLGRGPIRSLRKNFWRRSPLSFPFLSFPPLLLTHLYRRSVRRSPGSDHFPHPAAFPTLCGERLF